MMRCNLKRVNILAVILMVCFTTIAFAEDFSMLPVKGQVNMIDIGAKKCIPCKMMMPVMTKIEKIYKGKAHIAFIDVWENREQAPRFKIRSIPTQIFFNEKGEEIYRHVGFFDEESIIEQLTKMGVEKPDLDKKE